MCSPLGCGGLSPEVNRDEREVSPQEPLFPGGSVLEERVERLEAARRRVEGAHHVQREVGDVGRVRGSKVKVREGVQVVRHVQLLGK